MKQILLSFKQKKNPRNKKETEISCVRFGVRLHWFNTCDEILLSLQLTQNWALNLKNTWSKAHFMVPIFLTDTRRILDFSDSGSETADYIAKMWYLRIYFPLQMWFFSDSGMLWYVWDTGFYHASNGLAKNGRRSITPSFTLLCVTLKLYK